MAMVTAKPYTYEQLKAAREIRLITLHQGVGSDVLSLTISHACLDEKPTYEALSYVWGPQTPSYTIRCNDDSIAVGESLRDALQHLRQPDAKRVLWIDRIAINQEDLDERKQQVGLMADIYSSASLVVVWLGAPDRNIEPAISIISELAGQMIDFFKTQKEKSYAEAKTLNHPVHYPPPDAPAWSAVRILLQHPWFLRVWTFQEIVLAREAVIYCGAHSLRWERLEAFHMGMNIYPEGPNNEDSRLKGAEKPLLEISKARSLVQMPQIHKPEDIQLFLNLLPLLDSLRDRQATDPRDKVFALLNVANDAKNSDLKADYRKSHAEVYALTAKWLRRTLKSLVFLSLVEKKDKPDLISWVPDFRYRDFLNFLHQPTQIFRGNNRVYYSSGRANAPITEEGSSYQLQVRGIYVGTIVARTEPAGNLRGSVAIGAPVLDNGQWQQLARACAVGGLYPATGEPVDLAYHRLRIWDLLPNEGLLGRRRRKSPPTEIPEPGPISFDYAKDGLIRGARDDIGMSILRGTTRKRMFRTETGYIGVAHRSVELGDKVFVLMGGDTPFVLRPFGSNFFGFGGESYVHGIMDGEMLGIAKANREARDCLPSGEIKDLSWIDTLGDEPWPFDTEELVLV